MVATDPKHTPDEIVAGHHPQYRASRRRAALAATPLEDAEIRKARPVDAQKFGPGRSEG